MSCTVDGVVKSDVTPGHSFMEALRRNDLDAADVELARMGADVPVALLKHAGDLHVVRRRWAEAAEAFARVGPVDVGCRLRGNLSRNMAALARRRPELCEKLEAIDSTAPYEVAEGIKGKLTLVYHAPSGAPVGMSPGNDPALGLERSIAAMSLAYARAETIALCGIGDGYFLDAISRAKQVAACDMPQVVCVFEPSVPSLLGCLMIHDYTGANGPIEQERIFWFVGEDFDRQFADHVLADLMAPMPITVVHQSVNPQGIQDKMQGVYARAGSADVRRKAQIDAYYATFKPETFVDLLAGRGGRRPRVLLLTTRFSTVLQYSTRHAADGFRSLGWDVHVQIEPTPVHRLNRQATRELLHRFKPDLMFQLDHLRHEHGDMFPGTLPFICWIQDHLPNLTKSEAGKQVGPLDFVLTGARGTYVRDYAYPTQQVIDLVQLANAPKLPAAWKSDGEDLIYLSNWSRPVETVVDETLATVVEAGAHRAFFRVVVDAMIELYARGQSLPTRHSVEQMVLNFEDDLGPRLPNSHVRSILVNVLFDRVNNALYRRQSLSWVIEWAKRDGLSLGLYGRGWDKSDDYRAYARGPVMPGPDAEALIRRAKINLMLEPYPAHLHARMITGLLAGGTFLVRHNPFNDIGQMLLNFVNAHAPGADDTPGAMWKTPPHLRAQLDSLLVRSRCLAIHGDQIETVRCWQRAGVLVPQEQALPRLDEVSFRDPKELAEKGARLLAEPAARSDIAAAQKANIASRLTYEIGLQRVLDQVREKMVSALVQSRQAA